MTLFRQGLVSLFKETPYALVVAETDKPGDLQELCREHRPDVVIVELTMLQSHGNHFLSEVGQTPGFARLVGLKDERCDDMTMALAEKAGIKETIRRIDSMSALLNTLGSVEPAPMPEKPRSIEGGAPQVIAPRPRKLGLSPREREVAALIARGHSNRAISEELGLSEQSVKNLVSRILRKLRFTNRVQIALYSNELDAKSSSGAPV